MASIAVLPVLIGLAVDYAIQFQARFAEALREGSSAPRAAVEAAARGGPGDRHRAAGDGGRLRRAAALADPDGPLLRAAAGGGRRDRLRARAHRRPRHPFDDRQSPRRRRSGRLGAPAGARLRPRGRDRQRAERARRAGGGAPSPCRSRCPGGCSRRRWCWRWPAGSPARKTELISDIRELVPGDLPELQDVDELEDETGSPGEVNVTVDADDLTDPELIAWMAASSSRVLERHGYSRRVHQLPARTSSSAREPSLPTSSAGRTTPSREPDRADPRPPPRLLLPGGDRPRPGAATAAPP